MKQRLHKIAFFYFVFASIAAYLITVVSLIANQNWHEYFVSPVHLYCQLFAAGFILEMPVEILLSALPFLFVCVSFVLYLMKKRLYSAFALPVLLGNMAMLALLIIALVIGVLANGINSVPTGNALIAILSLVMNAALLIVSVIGDKNS